MCTGMAQVLLLARYRNLQLNIQFLKAENVEWVSTFQTQLQTNKIIIIIKENAKVEKSDNVQDKEFEVKGLGEQYVFLRSGESRDEGSSMPFGGAQEASKRTKNSGLIIAEGKRKREWGLISVGSDPICHSRKNA